MSSISQEQLKTLDNLRQRLRQLTQSIASLIMSIQQNDPLPAASSLQSQAAIISNNLNSISQHLSDNSALLSSLVAYPTPDFPGRTEAGVLSQLMRTKLEPYAEDWVAKGRALGGGTGAVTNHTVEGGDKGAGGLSGEELTELWHWAPIQANMMARERNWGGDYTREEKEMGLENVVTGLRRPLNDDSDEEEDEEDDEDEEEEGDGGMGIMTGLKRGREPAGQEIVFE
ncbi:mediator of RNA polymerase II transcription subunit 8 [Ascosphaera atra]|nr:mediator of RNA polymerase II transcription subunit 8 [Ascosphaera atra]